MARTDRDDWFGAAYAAHRRVAFRIARGVLGDDAAAEDVVQDVVLSLWLGPGAYDPERGSLGTSVGLLARSRALDRRRAAGAHEGAVVRAGAQLRALPDAT